MDKELFVCDTCKYSTKFSGHWNRHLSSAKHCRLNKSLVVCDGAPEVSHPSDAYTKKQLWEKNTMLGDTVRQLHDLAMTREEALHESRQEVDELKSTIRSLTANLAHAATSSPEPPIVDHTGAHDVNNTVNNTFIFVLDDPCIGPDGLLGITERMHEKVQRDFKGKMGRSEIIVLGLQDVQAGSQLMEGAVPVIEEVDSPGKD